jgi:hypothetical protein
VVAGIHAFVLRVYCELAFSQQAGTLFEQYRREVDSLLVETCADVFARMPAISRSLAEGDTKR